MSEFDENLAKEKALEYAVNQNNKRGFVPGHSGEVKDAFEAGYREQYAHVQKDLAKLRYAERVINNKDKEIDQLKAEIATLNGAIQIQHKACEIQLEDITVLKAVMEKILALDEDPNNHHKDASKCAICMAREALEKVSR